MGIVYKYWWNLYWDLHLNSSYTYIQIFSNEYGKDHKYVFNVKNIYVFNNVYLSFDFCLLTLYYDQLDWNIILWLHVVLYIYL